MFPKIAWITLNLRSLYVWFLQTKHTRKFKQLWKHKWSDMLTSFIWVPLIGILRNMCKIITLESFNALTSLGKTEQIWEYFFTLTLKFPGVRNFVFQTGSEVETFSKEQDMICSFFIVFTTQKYFIIFEKNHRKQT